MPLPTMNPALANALPSLTLLLALLIFSQLPVPFTESAVPLIPSFAIVYYWSLFRPNALPLWSLALLALLQDVLYGTPLGASLGAWLFLLVLCSFLRRRLMFQQFVLAWCVLVPMLIALWLLLSYVQHFIHAVAMGRWLSAYALPMFLTWLAYPLVHLLMNRVYHQLPPE